jgi:hypothetical protein
LYIVNLYKLCFRQVYPQVREPVEEDAELFNQCVENYADTYRIVGKSIVNHVWAQPKYHRLGKPDDADFE